MYRSFVRLYVRPSVCPIDRQVKAAGEFAA